MHTFLTRPVVAAALLAALLLAGCQPVDVGQLRGIVTGPEPSPRELLAARTLADYLGRMYDVELPVNPEGVTASKDAERLVFVGRAAATASGLIAPAELQRVRHDGYVVRAHDGCIAVAGYRDRGTVYGAYGLLRRLGCRFYTPRFEVVPQPPRKQIGAFSLSDKPAFAYRRGKWWAGGHSVDDLGDPRKALNPELFTKEAGSALWVDHTSGYLVPLDLYHDEHPEYFALRDDGKRSPKTMADNRIHLCISNPEVTRIAAERLLGWMDLQSQRRFFCVTPGDGGYWCQCEKCRAMDVEEGNYSDRWLAWVNELAAAVRDKHPDKVLLTAAYVGTAEAPARVKPAENVLVTYSPYWGVAYSECHPLTHPYNTEARLQFEAWCRAAPGRMGVYDYNMKYCPSWKAMAEKLKYYAAHGARAIWFCGSPTCWRDLFDYVCRSRLTWDPSLDAEQLKRDFVRAYYGKAAPIVLEYLALLEDRLQGYRRGIDQGLPGGFYSVDYVRRCLELFDEMLAAAQGDERVTAALRHERALMIEDAARALGPRQEGLTDGQRALGRLLFARRLASLIAAVEAAADERSRARAQKDLRGALRRFANIRPGEDADIVAVARAYQRAPQATTRAHAPAPVEAQPEMLGGGGVRLPAACFHDGWGPARQSWQCPPRVAMTIYTKEAPRPSMMQAVFEMPAAAVPAGPAVLRIEGQNSDKDTRPRAHLRITLNGRVLFEGETDFVRRGWSWQAFDVPAGVLHAGVNVLRIENVTDKARMDHYWFAMSEAVIASK